MTGRTNPGLAADSEAMPATRTAQIRTLNDAMRRSFAGRLAMTRGVVALGPGAGVEILKAVQAFDAFDPDNDPYSEHDFGSFEIAGERLFWKIDYYDRTLSQGSPDPADATVTTRVLTIMLADEY